MLLAQGEERALLHPLMRLRLSRKVCNFSGLGHGIDRLLTLREKRSGSGHGCERSSQIEPTEAALS